jgi:hypothetical protein
VENDADISRHRWQRQRQRRAIKINNVIRPRPSSTTPRPIDMTMRRHRSRDVSQPAQFDDALQADASAVRISSLDVILGAPIALALESAAPAYPIRNLLQLSPEAR